MSPRVNAVSNAAKINLTRAPRVRERRLLDLRVDQLPDVPHINSREQATDFVRMELGIPTADEFALSNLLHS